MRGRRAERGHHSVAHELLDRAAGPLDLRRHRVEEPVLDRPRPLRILPIRDGSRAYSVSEKNRGELAFHAPPP
jgi:hypothetical protein